MTTTLRAVVVAVESGNEYLDKQRRITLKFDGCSTGCDRLRLPIDALVGMGLETIGLEDVLDVKLWHVRKTTEMAAALTPDLMGRVTASDAMSKGKW